MTDDLTLIAELLTAASSGLALGCVYYGGLWLTVNRIVHWRQPAIGMMLSLLLRLALVAIGLYVLADGHWQRYAAALPGFLAARWWWIRHVRLKQVSRCH